MFSCFITRKFLCERALQHAECRKVFKQNIIGCDGVNYMERKQKDREGGILNAVAELFDLPADVVAGLPRLEMVGSRQLYLEHHAGILAYGNDQIDTNTIMGVLRVKGEGLTLLAMTAEELRIGGKISAVEWLGGAGC